MSPRNRYLNQRVNSLLFKLWASVFRTSFQNPLVIQIKNHLYTSNLYTYLYHICNQEGYPLGCESPYCLVVNLIFDRLFVTIKTLMITCKKYQPSNHQARIQCQKRDSATFYSPLLPLEEENKQPTIEKDKKRKKVVIHLLSCSHHATTIAIGRSGVRNIYLPTNTLYNLGVQSY